MKDEYDLSKMKSRPNPNAKHLKQQITIRLEIDVVEYFKTMSEETDIPYQKLINMYLKDCIQEHRKLNLKWAS